MRTSTWFGLAGVLVAGLAGYGSGGRSPIPAVAAPGHVPAPDALVARASLAVQDDWLDVIDAVAPSAGSASVPLPQGTFGETIGILRERARAGDPVAARALYEGLKRCSTYVPLREGETLESRAKVSTAIGFDSIAQAAEALRALQLERGLVPVDTQQVTLESVYSEGLAYLAELSSHCQGTGRVKSDDVREALATASDLDDPDARVANWFDVFTSWTPLAGLQARRDRALAGLRRALAAGDWRALAALGEIHEEGYLGPPSSALAYAYLHAAALDPRAGGSSPLPWRVGFGRIPAGDDVRRRMRGLESRLDAATLEAARAYGASRHAACCARGSS